MDLHVLRSPESENHNFSKCSVCMCACVCVCSHKVGTEDLYAISHTLSVDLFTPWTVLAFRNGKFLLYDGM